MGRGGERRRWKRSLKSARNACRFWIFSGWLLAVVALGVQAQETKNEATKPASPATSAAKPAPARTVAAKDDADDEFLEFLGSVDADATDDDWLDYLAQTDIRKVAKSKKKAQATAESQPAQDKAGK
jgi:hypothetical protein